MNWLKFGGLVSLAFVLGLLFAGLLDLPHNSLAQDSRGGTPTPAIQTQQTRTVGNNPAVQPLVTLSDAFATVAEAVRPSVVFITTRRTEKETEQRRVPPGFEQFFPRQRGGPQIEEGSGSGFIVSPDGYILTNTHVVEGADRVTVQLLDHRSFTAKVVGTDPLTDVAVVKIEANGLSAAQLGESHRARVGEWVLAVGNPLGDNFTFTVTSGIISAKGRGQLQLPNRVRTSIQDFIQTDAAINPGNSGGPLLNVRGEVIGINSAIASSTGYYSGYGFAIPIDLARQVMTQLISTGKVQRAVLGIEVTEVTAEDAQYAGLTDIRGVIVQRFTGDSPAKRAGLETGDIIVNIDGTPIEYVAQLQQVVGFRKPGETVKVEVARKGGQKKTLNVRLVAAEAQTQVAENNEQPEPAKPENAGASIQSLGITVEPVNAEWIDQLDLNPNFKGLVVRDVATDGPADGKLNDVETRAPDIITAVEGQPVRSESDLRTALRNGSSGIVSLEIYNPAIDNGSGSNRRVVRIRLAR
ncbi:MAG TPA: Do family serine endopeptidase [Gemmatimonadales bacterium]|nr:Do family serine endopeptidase [Gemmatimonadales bacterium]